MKTNRIRILYLVSRLRRVGPIFQLYNIIKNLDMDKFVPHIITLSPERIVSLLDRFKSIDVQCNSIGLSSTTGMIFGARRLKKLLKNNPVDLIHASDYRSILLCARHFAHIPRIATCRQAFDYKHFNLDGNFNPISAFMIVKSLKMYCRKCERVVGVSDYVRRSAGKGLSEKMVVIYNGVDQDIFNPPDKEEKEALRSKLNLPIDKHVFLSVGFLSKRKDPLTIIKAFKRHQLDKKAVLVFLGDGPLRQECLRLTHQNDNIHIIGFVQNVREYLGAADTFVSASLTEGCPNAVMEALAYGHSVVLSDITPHCEILNFNEQAGKMFRVKDTTALSDILLEMAGTGCTELSEAALNIIENHLNARKMSLKYQELYTELCE